MTCKRSEQCPVLCNTETELVRAKSSREALGHLATEHIEQVLDHSVAVTGTTDPTRARQLVRQKVAEDLDAADALVERGENFLKRIDDGCDTTPLTLRHATDGTTYTVTICRSTGLPPKPHPNEIYEPVTVTRIHK